MERQLPDLPQEIIEYILQERSGPENIRDVVRICTLNKSYAERCYERDFWWRYMEAMNYSSKDYLGLLLQVAEIGNEDLFFYLLGQEYRKLSPNKYRSLIESLGKIGNAAILFRLIDNPAPGHLSEQVAVRNAYLAALYYEHDEITEGLPSKIKDKRDILWSSPRAYENRKKIIRYAHSLKNQDKVDIEDFISLHQQTKIPTQLLINDIFSYDGNYRQLIQLVNDINDNELVPFYEKKIEAELDQIFYLILRNRYGNIEFLSELIDRRYNFLSRINWIVTANNKEAQKLLLRHINIKTLKFVIDNFNRASFITSSYVLLKLLKTDPDNKYLRTILFYSPDTLNDNEYLDIIDSYNPTEHELNNLLHYCYDRGYDYLVQELIRRYKIKLSR